MNRGRSAACLAVLLAAATVCGCGMGKAVQQTGETFDRYGCLAKDFKGETPCRDTDSGQGAGSETQ